MTTKCCLFIHNNTASQELFTNAVNDVCPAAICLTARNGIDALCVMLTENVIPSFILIELNLPLMGGLDFLRVIKQYELFKGIPVIVHSTSPKPHEIIELKELGAFAIYFRPYDYYGVCNMLMLYFSNESVGIHPN